MPDRLLHPRAQPGLQAVERPLCVAEPVLGPAVADRRVPVLAALGYAPKPPVQQAGDPGGIQYLVQSRQRQQLVLMAAARPAAVVPQQVAVDGGQRQALGGVGVPLGVVEHLLVGPPTGPLHPGRQPIHARRLAGCGHLRKQLVQVLQIPTIRAARRYDSPPNSTAATASRRTSRQAVGCRPAGRRDGPGGQDGGQPGQDVGGQRGAREYDNSDQTSMAGLDTCRWSGPVNVGARRASPTSSMPVGIQPHACTCRPTAGWPGGHAPAAASGAPTRP
jgi:hypothetical protein